LNEHKIEQARCFFRRQGILAAALLASLLVLGACSSSDSNGNTGTGLTAFNFDAGNSTLAAEIAAVAMSFFPEFTAISTTVTGILVNQSPSGSPFSLSICTFGTASVEWNDADGSTDLTVGDTATLTVTNCDFDGGGDTVNGTVTITATNVNLVAPPASTLGYTVAVNLTISGTDTTTIAANFSATTSTPNGADFTSVYTAADTSGQTASVTQNGTEYYRMGCFNATLMYTGTEIVAGNTDMTVDGVIVAANKVMSLAAGANLSFYNGYMGLGTRRLLSMSVPECASIGVPNGVSDSDGTYLDMEATGGGNITLHTFNSTHTETNTVYTMWDALTN